MITRHEGRYYVSGYRCFYCLETGKRFEGTQPGEQVKARFEECEGTDAPGAAVRLHRDGVLWLFLANGNMTPIRVNGRTWADLSQVSFDISTDGETLRQGNPTFFYKLVIE